MKEKVMSLVKEICKGERTICRGLDKSDLARELMNLANIPQDAKISEISRLWDNQVIILFLLPGKDNYYSLFAGIGLGGNFYFKLNMIGKSLPECLFPFF